MHTNLYTGPRLKESVKETSPISVQPNFRTRGNNPAAKPKSDQFLSLKDCFKPFDYKALCYENGFHFLTALHFCKDGVSRVISKLST